MSKSAPALPYRVLKRESVLPDASGWALVVGGETLDFVSDGSAIVMWDALLDFKLEREFVFPVDIMRELGVRSLDAQAELVVSCRTGGGTNAEVLFRGIVREGEGESVRAVLAPPSQRLARDLVITSGVYLSKALRGERPLAPHLEGARLWELTERMRLEGGAARLPMYAVPFPEVFAGDGIDEAEFHVELADELDMELEASLVVYVNTSRSDFVAELGQRSSDAEKRLWNGVFRRVLLQAIMAGVLEEPADHVSATPTSLVPTVRRWAGHVWPNEAPEQLRSLVTSRYALCEAQIDAWLKRLAAGGKGGTSN